MTLTIHSDRSLLPPGVWGTKLPGTGRRNRHPRERRPCLVTRRSRLPQRASPARSGGIMQGVRTLASRCAPAPTLNPRNPVGNAIQRSANDVTKIVNLIEATREMATGKLSPRGERAASAARSHFGGLQPDRRRACGGGDAAESDEAARGAGQWVRSGPREGCSRRAGTPACRHGAMPIGPGTPRTTSSSSASITSSLDDGRPCPGERSHQVSRPIARLFAELAVQPVREQVADQRGRGRRTRGGHQAPRPTRREPGGLGKGEELLRDCERSSCKVCRNARGARSETCGKPRGRGS